MKLWIAQGFGVGRIPVAPGTFGSLVGVLWFGLLLMTGSLWLFTAGTIAGIALSVWLCGAAEKAWGKRTPAPWCWMKLRRCRFVSSPGWQSCFGRPARCRPSRYFFSARTWPLTLGVFVAFRFFDVAKPWPVRQSQSLPGGWGVTIDDVLAAVYVNVVVLLVYAGKPLLTKQ